MKQFLIINSLLLLYHAMPVSGQQNGYLIKSCNQTITIRHGANSVQKLPKELAGFHLVPDDYIITSNGEAEMKLGEQGNATVRIPADKTVMVGDLVNSSYYRLESDSYWSIVGKIVSYFMTTDETKDDYFNRNLKENGGVQITKGDFNTDILGSGNYKKEMAFEDALAMKTLNDSLALQRVKDSVVYYLEDAIFCEQRKYLEKAYNNYKNAYNYSIKKNRKSVAVTAVYKQFLYRVGQFDEGDSIN